MIRNILFLVLAVVGLLAPELTHGAVVPAEGPEEEIQNQGRFTYIGSLTNQPEAGAFGILGTPVTSEYYLSPSGASYDDAAIDCEDLLNGATLLYIETEEEFKNVTKLIRSTSGVGSRYWVGGRFDATSQSGYAWENDYEFGSWAPWDTGFPASNTSLTRVYLRTTGAPVFRTQYSSVITRFICEKKVGDIEEDPEPCFDDNDLVIAIDSSGSISRSDYTIALEFAARLGTTWIENTRNRLSVVIYSTNESPIFTFQQTLSADEIRNRVYNAPHLQGSTASDLALDYTILEFAQNPRPIPVPKNLVFLTDGHSNNPTATLAAARRVQNAGIRGFSVGIGNVNQVELLAIAGGNGNHVFNTDGFQDLLKLLLPVSRTVCNK